MGKWEPDTEVVALLGDVCLDMPQSEQATCREAAAWLTANWEEFDPKTATSIRLMITSARVGSYVKGVRSEEGEVHND